MAQDIASFFGFLRLWLRIGLLSFGGPAGQIAQMHRELVDERPLVRPDRFQQALSFCMMLPGPEAQQLATYCGWMMRGVTGGLVAGLLFILPGAVVMLALSAIYCLYGDLPQMRAALAGLQAAVVAIIFHALVRISRRTLHGSRAWVIALSAFLAQLLLQMPFPVVIALAAVWASLGADHLAPAPAAAADAAPERTGLSPVGLMIGVVLWLLPTLLLLQTTGWSLPAEIGLFFSQLSLMSFGGAYAVLAYAADYATGPAQWLSKVQLLDGLGLAETTPGPLILVLQFIGFVAAYAHGGFWMGVAGAGIALWATFVPSFLLVLGCAPWVQRITAMPSLRQALQGISAAVVGIIAVLGLRFALHVCFGAVRRLESGPVQLDFPAVASWRPDATLMVAGAVLLLGPFRRSVPEVLALSLLAGLLRPLLP